MAEDSSLQVVYRSAIVAIGDNRCSASNSGWSEQKWSSSHKIVFLRCGAFFTEARGRRVFADPNQIVFFNRNEEYRTRHPVAGGDRCSAFVVAREVLSEIRGALDA